MWSIWKQQPHHPGNKRGSYIYPASLLTMEHKTFTLVTLVTLVFIFATSLNLLTETQREPIHQTYQTRPREPGLEGNKTSEMSNVCRDVFEIGKASRNMTEWMADAVDVIRDRKTKKLFVPSVYYEYLGYDSPSMVNVVNDSTGLLGTNVTLAKEWRMEQSDGHLPHLSCRLRNFDAPEVDRCVRARRNAGKRTWITYIGDSRIRFHVEVLIDLLRDLRPKIITYKGEEVSIEDFLGMKGLQEWTRYKHNFRVEVELERSGGASLVITFQWASLLEMSQTPANWDKDSVKVGAKEYLHKLTETPDEELPDMLILNTGAWQLVEQARTDIDLLDKKAVIVMSELRPVLAALATRMTVVWALPDTFKEYINHNMNSNGHFTRQTNRMLEWLSNAQTSLQPPGVIVWDSFLPLAQLSLIDCMNIVGHGLDQEALPNYKVFSSHISWECSERLHTGIEVLSVAVQMMLNHVCNPFLPGQYCCGR
ncbi:uncharacterized protein LOC123510873 [Portunus trituberculatus]|uniref:uncharacterized protein LOC123510873 n=1 Tax=Portunus trituberculatus TaxID=210409 RepID=UPI001E1CBA09|nr:uncharacterized protein LOC123510873 [Portunus trituberculatus]